jgi:peptidoglycan/LPS O-acetylase OafA/YrhL
MVQSSPVSQEKPNLDLLRAFAVLLVIFDHLMLVQGIAHVGRWSASWIGVFGVYLFFVHTCLVLMWSLERKPHTLDFYIRRAFRIYPLAMVAIVIVLAFHLPFSPAKNAIFAYYPHRLSGILQNLLLIQDFGRSGNVLGVLWSLPLEVDMYILLPMLYFFVRKNFHLWPLLLMWCLACALARPALSQGNMFATVIPCFLPGVMAYVLFRNRKPIFPSWAFALFLVSLLCFFMHFSRVLASWPACLALGLGLPLFRQIRLAPLKRSAHEIAKYSYGMYLGHPFALGIAFKTLEGHSRWLQIPLALCLTPFFAIVGYHLVERPLIRFGARLAAHAEARYEQREMLDELSR